MGFRGCVVQTDAYLEDACLFQFPDILFIHYVSIGNNRRENVPSMKYADDIKQVFTKRQLSANQAADEAVHTFQLVRHAGHLLQIHELLEAWLVLKFRDGAVDTAEVAAGVQKQLCVIQEWFPLLQIAAAFPQIFIGIEVVDEEICIAEIFDSRKHPIPFQSDLVNDRV